LLLVVGDIDPGDGNRLGSRKQIGKREVGLRAKHDARRQFVVVAGL
jgi:hypothetical protein